MAYKRKRKEGNPSEVKKLGEMMLFGVSTRAKTMALNGDECYLHLRSRKLERFPPHLFVKKARKSACALEKKGLDLDEKENIGVFGNDKDRENVGLGENERENKMVEEINKGFKKEGVNKNEERVLPCNDVEDSTGENDPDFENMERVTRESTPNSFIDQITTRMSSNKASSSSSKATIVHQINPIRPSLQELELFFADAEKHCNIRKFIKKK